MLTNEEMKRLSNSVTHAQDDFQLLQGVQDLSNEIGMELQEQNAKLSQNEAYQLDGKLLKQFDRKIQRELKKMKRLTYRGRRWMGRVSVAVAIMIVLLCMTVLSVGALRRVAIDFLIGLDGTYGTINTPQTDVGISNVLIPSYLPNGFTQSDLHVVGGMTTIDYMNTSNEHIFYSQQSGEVGGTVDTENANVQTLDINGLEAKISEKGGGLNILVWGDGDFTFSLQGTDADILIKMAQSVNYPKQK